MKAKIIESGRTNNKSSLKTLTDPEMDMVKGGGICICDARFCLDCSCVQAGSLCVCDAKRNCEPKST